MRTALASLVAILFLTPAGAADPKDPDIGLDYRDLVRQQMALVAEGKAKEAVELLDKNAMPNTFGDNGREALQKKFAVLYGAGGKFVGQEVVGYKKLSSRLYRFYAVAHFEKAVVVFSYLFVKTTDQSWKINKLTVSDGVEELETVVPFVALGAVRD